MRRIIKTAIIATAIAFMAATGPADTAHAITAEERLDDPAAEQRARDISLKLRCLVCQNQSIDDSDAPFARDMRGLIRERITAGQTDDEIIAFIRARYGDYILLSPPFDGATALLWLAPFGFLAIGIAGIAVARHKTPRVRTPRAKTPRVKTPRAKTQPANTQPAKTKTGSRK